MKDPRPTSCRRAAEVSDAENGFVVRLTQAVGSPDPLVSERVLIAASIAEALARVGQWMGVSKEVEDAGP